MLRFFSSLLEKRLKRRIEQVRRICFARIAEQARATGCRCPRCLEAIEGEKS